MKIPVTVITGFLGAGKTTLLRHLVANAQGRRLGLLINEFGDLGCDRDMLLGCGIEGCGDSDIVELTNGCLCCTVADEFLPSMEKLLDRPKPPEHLVIETSGLALPKPLVKAFNWLQIRSRATVDGVITVVDAPAVAAGRFADDPEAVQSARAADPGIAHESPLAELFEDQLMCADMVILNKTDLVDSKAMVRVRNEVRAHLSPHTRIVAAVHGALDPGVVLGLGAAVEDHLDGRPSHHEGDDDHDHDEFVSFIARPGSVTDPEALAERIRRIAAEHDVLRIKGFIDVPGKTMRHVVQAVGGRVQRYYDRPWGADEDRHSMLIVIGQRGIDQRAVSAALIG